MLSQTLYKVGEKLVKQDDHQLCAGALVKVYIVLHMPKIHYSLSRIYTARILKSTLHLSSFGNYFYQ